MLYFCNQGQAFYFFLPPLFETSFNDKTVTELHTPKWTIPREHCGCS